MPDGARPRRAAAAAVALVAALAPAQTAAAPAPRVSVIGDSVAASLLFVTDAARALGGGLDLRLDLQVCRRLVDPSCTFQGVRPPSALQAVRTRGPALGRVVVLKVGYNDGSARYAGHMRQVMRALRGAGVTSVVWVTLTDGTADRARINRAIRAAPARYPEACVADWAAASAGRPWFQSDGVHLNPTGARALARLLRPLVVRAARTGTCRSDAAPPGAAPSPAPAPGAPAPPQTPAPAQEPAPVP